MKKTVKDFAEKRLNIKIINKTRFEHPYDLEDDFYTLLEKSKDKTMTSTERMYSMYQATHYISDNNIEGAVVECGVWKGGSIMMSALNLVERKDTERQLFLYDTFEGMSTPTNKDVNYADEKGEKEWKKSQKDSHNDWCYSPLEDVQNTMKSTKYPFENIHFIKGKVEETIPKIVPSKIALLRLDTDWYESVYHSLVHLYPLLVTNGILIIDDYGYWKGAREAVDKYFAEKNLHPILNRIDTTGRLVIKTTLQ